AAAEPVHFENQVVTYHQTPEAMGPVRDIRSMNRVLGKGDGVVDRRWQGGDRGVDAQGMKAPDQLPVKVSDRPYLQGDPLDATIVDGNDHLMVDEVDIDRKAGPAAPDGRRREASRRQVEGHVRPLRL